MYKILTKLLSFCLCVVMIFSVAACNKNGDSGSDSTNVEEFAFENESLSLLVGETKSLALKGADGQSVTFYSTKEEVATVNGEGSVTAIKAGTAFVVATMGEKETACKITVTEAEKQIYAIGLDSTSVSVIAGVEYTLNAVVCLNGQIITDTVEWTVNGDSVGQVEKDGNKITIKSDKSGIAEIVASYGGVSASCVVKVMSATAVRLPAVNATVDGSSVKWDAVEGAEYYEIQVPGGAWIKTTETQYSNSSLVQKYGQCDLKIRACAGNSVNYYDGEVVTVQLSVELFLNFKGNVAIWTKAEGATGYDVYLNDEKVASLDANARTYTITKSEITKVYILAKVGDSEKTSNQVYYCKDTTKITDILEDFENYAADSILSATNCDVQTVNSESLSGESSLYVAVKGKTQGVGDVSTYIIKNTYGLKAGDVVSYWAMPTNVQYNNGAYTYQSVTIGALPAPRGYSNNDTDTAFGLTAKTGEWTRLTYTLTENSFDANGDLVMVCRNTAVASENIQARNDYYLDYGVFVDDLVKLSEHDGLTHEIDLTVLNDVNKGINSTGKATVTISSDEEGNEYATFASAETAKATFAGYNDLFLIACAFPGSPETLDGKRSLLATPRSNMALRGTTISFEIKTKSLESLKLYMLTCPNKAREFTAIDMGIATNSEWTKVSFTFDLTDVSVFSVATDKVNEVMIRNLSYTFNAARVNVVEE